MWSKKQKKPFKRGTTYQVLKKKVRRKKPAGNTRQLAKRKQPAKIRRTTRAKAATMRKIVRIMGHGQFSVDHKILQRLNEIDSMLVQLVSADRPNDNEFKKHLIELTKIVEQNGKQLDSKEIIQSDIILPSADLSVDEAKRLFTGEGVVPEI